VKRLTIVLATLLLGIVVLAAYGCGGSGQAQAQQQAAAPAPAPAPQGPSPEQQAAIAKQEALEKSTPQLQIAEDVLPLTVPGHTIGEAVGVAKNSKGNLFVFTRSGNAGPARGSTASQLFESIRASNSSSSGGRTTTRRRSRTPYASTSTTTSG
jgi:hypothetical protein